MRLALFGGTFDPVHEAHLAIARAAAARFALDRVLFVPAAHPPHKAAATRAPYEDRVRMAELACAGEPGFEVSRLEENTPRSYSIDTIEKVRAGLGAGAELFSSSARMRSPRLKPGGAGGMWRVRYVSGGRSAGAGL